MTMLASFGCKYILYLSCTVSAMVDPCHLLVVCSFEEYTAGGRVTGSRLRVGGPYLPCAFPLPLPASVPGDSFDPWCHTQRKEFLFPIHSASHSNHRVSV